MKKLIYHVRHWISSRRYPHHLHLYFNGMLCAGVKIVSKMLKICFFHLRKSCISVMTHFIFAHECESFNQSDKSVEARAVSMGFLEVGSQQSVVSESTRRGRNEFMSGQRRVQLSQAWVLCWKSSWLQHLAGTQMNPRLTGFKERIHMQRDRTYILRMVD